MLAKVNSITRGKGNKKGQLTDKGINYIVRITKLDIDDLGSVVPLKEIELTVSSQDESILKTLENSHFVAIFTESDIEEHGGKIILANGITESELNKEKERTIARVNMIK